MARTRRPIKYATPRTPKQKAIRITFHVLVWFGAAILYYVGFSLFFDTPVEYELKHSTDQLRDEYTRLEARYDSLRTVMENVSERDRNVFNILFESDPYDFDTEYETKRLATYESLLDKSDRQIILELKEKVRQSEATLTKLNESYLELQRLLDTVGDGRNRFRPYSLLSTSSSRCSPPPTACASTPSTAPCNPIRASITRCPKVRASSPRRTAA